MNLDLDSYRESIKQARKAKRLTQKDVNRACGFRLVYEYHFIERGRLDPTPEHVDAISRVLFDQEESTTNEVEYAEGESA